MQFLARASLILVIVLVSVSAYLRLAHSGLGCLDWPACYGNIGVPETASLDAAAVYDRITQNSEQAMAWATPLHRLVASVLGLLVLAMTLTAWISKRGPNRAWAVRGITTALLALTVFLAMLGIRSGSLHNPAVVMGNLGGGFAMLGLLGWLVFRDRGSGEGAPRVRRLTGLALVVLCLQILLGGLTSANFAATACQSLPDCHGSYLPGPDLGAALELEPHQVTPSGQAIGGPERADIHKLHRLGSLATAFLVIVAAIAALRARSDFRRIAWALLALVALEFGIGVVAILTRLPIGIAVAHNWVAGLLLLALIVQYRISQPAMDSLREDSQ